MTASQRVAASGDAAPSGPADPLAVAVDPLQQRIGRRVRRRREQLGLTQQELAGQELTRGFISQVEKGLVMPSLKSLELLASRLHWPIAYFLQEQEPDESPSEAARLLDLACFHLVAGEPSRAEPLVERARAMAGHAPVPAVAGRLALAEGLKARRRGAADEAAGHLERAASLLGKADDGPACLRACLWWGDTLLELGDAAQAAAVLEQALALAERVGSLDPHLHLQAQTLVALAWQRCGRTEQARRLLEQVAHHSQVWGLWCRPDELLLAQAACCSSPESSLRREELLRRAASLAEGLSHPSVQARALKELARELGHEGGSQACALLERALGLAEGQGEVQLALQLRSELARLLAERGELPRALELLQPAVEAARGTARVRLLVALAELLVQTGEREQARQVLQEAVELGEREGLRREVAVACTQLGQLLRQAGEHEEAAAYLARAVALYESTASREMR